MEVDRWPQNVSSSDLIDRLFAAGMKKLSSAGSVPGWLSGSGLSVSVHIETRAMVSLRGSENSAKSTTTASPQS